MNTRTCHYRVSNEVLFTTVPIFARCETKICCRNNRISDLVRLLPNSRTGRVNSYRRCFGRFPRMCRPDTRIESKCGKWDGRDYW